MWGLVTHVLAVAQGLLSPFHGTSRPRIDNVELYTGPYASGGAWASAYDHAVDLVSQMTVEEKVAHSTLGAELMAGEPYYGSYRTMSSEFRRSSSSWSSRVVL
jgi:hypothetical protein